MKENHLTHSNEKSKFKTFSLQQKMKSWDQMRFDTPGSLLPAPKPHKLFVTINQEKC